MFGGDAVISATHPIFDISDDGIYYTVKIYESPDSNRFLKCVWGDQHKALLSAKLIFITIILIFWGHKYCTRVFEFS